MGYVIVESEEYRAMSGRRHHLPRHSPAETGMLPLQEALAHRTVESPAGLIRRAHAECRNRKVLSVRFTNQLLFVNRLDVPVEVDGHLCGYRRCRLGRKGFGCRRCSQIRILAL